MMNGNDRPSPRRLSQLFMRGGEGLPSDRNRTALLAFFGQVVTNEIVMSSESGCPIEVFKIDIEKCDEAYDVECKGDKYIPFHRAAYDRETGHSPNQPREQINQVTAWIDGSFIYSTSETWLNVMRSFVNGTLLTEKGGTMPVRNTMRVPLFNNPIPHQMRMSDASQLFCKFFAIAFVFKNESFQYFCLFQCLVIHEQTKIRLYYRLRLCSYAGITFWLNVSKISIHRGAMKIFFNVLAAL